MHLLSPVDEYFRWSALLVLCLTSCPFLELFGKTDPPPTKFTHLLERLVYAGFFVLQCE